MSYPFLPSNRLIVNGVDLSEKFKMALLDGYTLGPPTAKTYTVDIPGGNGSMDLTEALIGDTTYQNRTQTFEFVVVDPEDFEGLKTKIMNFLHGKSFPYVMTMDPEYVYEGRFSVESFTRVKYASALLLKMKIKVTSNPYKHKDPMDATYDAVGGIIQYLNSGREPVRPIFITDGFLKIIHKGKIYQVPKGTWQVNDVIFNEGSNRLYLSSYDIKNLRWKELVTKKVTFAEFCSKPLYSWYKTNGNFNSINDIWRDMEAKTWNDVKDSSWLGLYHAEEVPSTVKDITIKYEWGDL